MHALVPQEQWGRACPYPPTPQHCLFFYIDDLVEMQKEGGKEFQKQAPAVVVGPQVTRVNLIVGKSHKAVAVGFHPGGLFRLLGIPMSEIYDDGFNAQELMGPEIRIVNERLRDAPDFNGIRNIIETFLLQRLQKIRPALPFDRAMQELQGVDGNLAIDQVAALSCLSLRQFERKCQERIGLSPKLFARLARFSRAYRLREKDPSISWTHITYECGYFDQMHLIRDFRQFAGVTPRLIDSTLSHTPVRMQSNISM